jgi:hypothetical protein
VCTKDRIAYDAGAVLEGPTLGAHSPMDNRQCDDVGKSLYRPKNECAM